MPLFILRIAVEGPAYSLLNIGDEIIEINGFSTVGMTHSDAVNAISQSGPAVKLKLRRNYVTTGNWGPTIPPMQTFAN
jgi:C-terminal processing protease CtpA/Prc